jgi:(p)ppGpp synthase/HD superfamily hydrolase
MEEAGEQTIEQVITQLKRNNKKANIGLIVKAYKYAKEKHEGQRRVSRGGLYNTSFKRSSYIVRIVLR